MCGRARCTLHREEIAQMAGVSSEAFVDGDKYRPCENMGPGRYGPVTFRARGEVPNGGDRHSLQKQTKLQAMRWGLIPSFTKPHVKPDHFIMFNARSESLQERPAFRRLLETKRCVIFSDGYYEWHQVDKKEKQPHYIYSTKGPLKFAGLYDSWMNEDGEKSFTYTMLTTEAPTQLTWMHPRIPVILSDDGASRWLSDVKFDSLRDLLVGYTGDDLKWHPVDKRVGSTKFQSEDCSKKVDIKHAANIASFFGGPTSKEQPFKDESVSQKFDASTPTPKSVPTPASQTASATTSQSDSVDSSHEEPKFATAASLVSPPRSATKSDRSSEAFRSPIKFLFQQQQMVQQAEEILAASEGRAPRTSSSEMGTKRPASSFSSSPIHPSKSPKKSKPSPKKPATKKTPQRGTLLAYFQKS